jgi:hypothetical protein
MRQVVPPQSRCRFALTRCDITPPQGIYHRMWGAARHERATGVHRPLTATVLAFAPTGSRGTHAAWYLILLDHCLLWWQEMHDLTQSIASTSGTDVQRLVVTFSHTHAAGLMGYERASLPGGDLIRPYLQEVARRVAQLVRLSGDSLQEAWIQYAQGTCPLAAHRDYWDADAGQFVCGYNPQQPGDQTLLVARVAGVQDQTLGSIVNYACHPTTLAWQNTLISPDFVGALRETVEQHTGHAAPCAFLQGASGDLGPRVGFVGDTAVADRNGRQLAFSALALLESLDPPGTRYCYAGAVVSGATIGTWEHRPLDAAQQEACSAFRFERFEVALSYRPDLRSAEQAQQERETWRRREEDARRVGDASRAAECRAMVERMDRHLTRLKDLPQGSYPYRVTMARLGPAIYLGVEGEPYSLLQRRLRERFAGTPIVVCNLTGGARCSYLPPRDVYGRGIYQESVALLAPGSLEQVIDEIARRLRQWGLPENG